MRIDLNAFGGIAPSVDPSKLAAPLAQVAKNCRFESGGVGGYKMPLAVDTPSKPGTKLSIHRWGAMPNGDAQGMITGASRTNPVVVTAPGHGRTSGARVFLAGMVGMGQVVNRTFTITVVDADRFSLNGENGTAYQDYVSGGTWVQQNGFWFHWTTVVDVIRGPIAGDTTERTYYTGAGAPKVTNSSLATTSGTDYPYAFYDLGLPAPATAPTASALDTTGPVTGATQANPGVISSVGHGRTSGQKVMFSSVGGMTQLNGQTVTITVINADSFSVGLDTTAYGAYTSGGTWKVIYDIGDLESRAYAYTFVSQWGEEGPPSDPSSQVLAGPGQDVSVGAMAGAPGSTWNIVTAKRIYRTVSGTAGAQFLFVMEVPVANATATDNKRDLDLGEALPSVSWDAPPPDMHSLAIMPNGIGIGLSGLDVCLSVAYMLHAWPTKYRLTTDSPGVAVAVIGQDAIIGTRTYPYLLSGSDPANMLLTKLDAQQGCISKRSMVAIAGLGAVYASPDGLVSASPAGAIVLTEALLTRDDWQRLYRPQSIVGGVWEGRYVAFYDNGTTQAGFIFDPRRPALGLVHLDLYATAVWNDPLSDALYLMIGSQVQRFNGGDASMGYTWRSPAIRLPLRSNLRAARVYADSYSAITLKLYADGVQRLTRPVTDSKEFTLPSGYTGRVYEVEIVAADRISRVTLGEGTRELRT